MNKLYEDALRSQFQSPLYALPCPITRVWVLIVAGDVVRVYRTEQRADRDRELVRGELHEFTFEEDAPWIKEE